MLVENVEWGVAPTWSSLAISIPVAMLAYTGVETVSNLAEEARDPVRTVPQAYKLVASRFWAATSSHPMRPRSSERTIREGSSI
jgi:APA family basic amino acid/polyamine antiporter